MTNHHCPLQVREAWSRIPINRRIYFVIRAWIEINIVPRKEEQRPAFFPPPETPLIKATPDNLLVLDPWSRLFTKET